MTRFLLILLMCLLWIVPVAAQTAEAELILQHDSGVVTASWNADETQILSASERGLVQVWSVADGELLLTIDHAGNPLTHAAWVDEGAAILSADESGMVLLSDAADGTMLLSWQLDGMPLSLVSNAAETVLLAFTRSGKGAILSLDDGQRIIDIEAPVAISGAGWHSDESRVRAWSEAGRIYYWDLESGEDGNFSLPHRSMLLGMAWDASDTRVLAWFTNGAVQVYETDGVSVNSRALSSVRHRSFVQRAIWSRDESLVMSWAGDDTVHIWSANDGRSVSVFRHEDWVIGARWDPDEVRVLSWSHIYVYLWDGNALVQRYRHRNLVRGAVWNSDASRILSWSWDKTVRVWKP